MTHAMSSAATKAAIVALSLAIASAPVRAGDLNAEVTDMFNSLGAVGNYTAPGAFKGQTYNTYTGGSLYYRSPNRTYQLASIQFPTVRAGCGGIDLFAGSFSHISADEFRNALRNITSALPGAAFSLALKSVSPLLGGVSDQFKTWQDMINGQQIRTCETATALVSSAAQATGFDANRACRTLAVQMGLDADDAAAAKRCASNAASVLGSARGSSDPNISSQVPFVGNFTWKALKSIDTLDDSAREMVMSITGALIFPDPAANRDPDFVGPTINAVSQLLYGQSDAGGGNINVQMLRCDEFVNCNNVTRVNRPHLPLTRRVQALMQSISDSIRNRNAIPNNSAAVGFVNTTSLPVWRMLSVGNTIPGSGMAETLIGNYSEVIAVDYAITFMSQFINVASAAMLKQHLLSAQQRELANQQRADLQAFLASLQREQSTLYQKVTSLSTVATDLERLERQLRGNLSTHVVDMLGFAAASQR